MIFGKCTFSVSTIETRLLGFSQLSKRHTSTYLGTPIWNLELFATELTTSCEGLQYQCGWTWDDRTFSTYCNKLQHTATHCNTLQHTTTHGPTHCNTLPNTLQSTAAHCNTHRNTLDRTWDIQHQDHYGVATISRLLKIIRLFCERSS